MDLEGTTIGQIRLDGLVGEGGMGAVYRGFDLRLQRPVAVKTLHDRYRDDPLGRARFLREAQILSRLDHPGICKVYGIVRHGDSDLLVLEWLDGTSLGEAMKGAGHERLLDLAIDIADALAAAHRQQIVHRDLKPDNVIVTTDGLLKILDFGIARSAEVEVRPAHDLEDEESFFFEAAELDSTWPGGERASAYASDARPPALTTLGNTVGTIAYMSPEQVGGLPVSVASDVYSLGILLQEMFTGRRAYDPASPVQLMSLVVVGKTRPLGDLDPLLARLIRDLQGLDESARPTAQDAAQRLRSIRRAPETRRRKAMFRAAVATVAASLALGSAAVVHGRLQAGRSAAEAREMTRIATEAEWLMRAEHLAPAHDLRPARAEVRQLMDELQQRSKELDARGQAAGALALGRAALALDEIDEAVSHLRRAWAGGLRDARVAASYGLALAEQTRRRLVHADRQVDEGERRRLRAAAEDSRDLARDLLASASRGEELEPATAELARAHLAFLEDDWQRALLHADRASQRDAWFYEGHLLAARTLRQRLLRRVHADGNEVGAGEDLAEARKSLRRAVEVGRSDPEVRLEHCALVYDAYVLGLQSKSTDFGVDHQEGLDACGSALELDVGDSRGHLLTALLLARAAERASDASRDSLLEAGIEAAGRALDLDPGDAEAWRALAMGHMVRGDYLAERGGDPESALAAVIEACRRGLQVAPRDLQLINLIGNAEGVRAERAWSRGEDPSSAAARAIVAYERAIEVGNSTPHLVTAFPRTNLALQIEVAVRWLAFRGEDPRPLAEEGIEHARLALEANDKSGYAWTAMTQIATHVAQWHLDREEVESAGPWIDRALAAAEQTRRWRSGSYADEAVALAHLQASRGAQASDRPRARELLSVALESSKQLVQDDPAFVRGWIVRARTLGLAAELAAEPAEAGRLARAAVEAAQSATAADSQHFHARRVLDESRRRLKTVG